ncbi:MAG: hypothetical protein H0W07_09855 [Chloroflexi bacterium]|nr:hypothetical protein [Chloroflexota bacterium]
MAQVTRRTRLASIAGFALSAAMLTGAPLVSANDADIIRRGDCTASSDWKLKLSPENGRIEVEFEVDQNRNGDTWDIRLKRDGVVVATGARTTTGPSGSFEFRRVISESAGSDSFIARAVNRRTGEVCRGTATSNF